MEYSRNVMPKGLQLRKKCGQVKVQEHYRHHDALFSLGHNVSSLPGALLRGMKVFIPSAQCVQRFGQILLDMIVFSDCQVIILMQSVIRTVMESGNFQVRRLLKEMLFGSINSRCVVFYNENNIHTFKFRRVAVNESILSYSNRLFDESVKFLRSYVKNLSEEDMRGLSVPITVVLSDPKDSLVHLTQCRTSTLSTLSCVAIKDYIMGLAGEIGDTKRDEMLANLSTAFAAEEEVPRPTQSSGDGPPGLAASDTADLQRHHRIVFSRHLSPAEVRTGLSSGTLQCGELSVFLHGNYEGEVLPTSVRSLQNSSTGYSSVFISGSDLMNRAMHGDTIVYELLPRSKWRGLQKSLLLEESGEQEETAADSEEDGVIVGKENDSSRRVPTARVMGIIKRQMEEIAATIPYKRAATHSADSLSTSTTTKGRSEDSFVVSNRDEFVLCIPLDRRLPRIRIATRQWEKLQGHRVIVVVDNWPSHSKFPNGHFVRTLGPCGDWRTELEALMLKHNVFPHPFSTQAMACLPQLSDTPSTETESSSSKRSGIRDKPREQWVDSHWELPSLDGRKDLRTEGRIFSVDPPGCQDIDDAMSVRWIEDGVLEVGIHIADVCAFVPQGSALDAEAQARSTTVYLTHARIDMLPSLISSDIASLHGEKDRFAVTVLFRVNVRHKKSRSPVKPSENMIHLDEEGDIEFEFPPMPHWVGRTAIHSVAAMTYDQAHNLIQGLPPDSPGSAPVPEGQAGRPVKKELWGPLQQDLTILTAFTRHLLRTREASGALDLSQSEGGQLKFKLDENGFPVQVDGSHSKEIHNTIAELMILANSAVARYIYSELPSASLFRLHPPPSLERMSDVHELTESLGLHGLFVGTSDEDIQKEAREFKAKLRKDKRCSEGVINFITAAVIRCMSAARYQCSEESKEQGKDGDGVEKVSHYGLGVGFYTHFTSPIRRYADVIVHRQLLAVLQYKEYKANRGLMCAENRKTDPKSKSHPSYTSSAVVPESQAISIVDENALGDSRSSTDGRHVKSTRTADGRMIFDKVGISATAEVDSLPTASVSNASIAVSVPNQAVAEGAADDDDDFDPLDDLLGDVGDSLMDTVGKVDNSAGLLSLQTKVAAHPTAEGDALELDDELDMLLGDMCMEDGLTASKSTGISKDDENIGATNLPDATPPPGISLKDVVGESCVDATQTSLVVPYPSFQLSRIADHLNAMNKRAKMAQFECQELYLRHYFTKRREIHWAVVYALKQNGFMAFVPAFDHKGPVHLTGRDNSTVHCLPRLLGLIENAGEAVEEGSYNGLIDLPAGHTSNKTAYVRAFKELKCALLRGGAEENGPEVDELVICPNGADPLTCSNGSGVLRLRYLQRVQVLVSCSSPNAGNRQLGIPQLCLQLLDVDEQASGGQTDSNAFKSESHVAATIPDKNSDSKQSSLWKVEAVKGDSPMASLYRVCMDFRRKESKEDVRVRVTEGKDDDGGEEEKEAKRITDARNRKKRDKWVKAVKEIRHSIEGTGHVAFGPADSLPPLFLAKSGHGHGRGGSGSGAGGEDGAAQLLRGKAAAMHQMKAWGEEWAEEEELPGGAGGGEGGGGEGGGVVDVSKYNIGRETAMATQRINKVKTAKRNSKY